VVYLGPHLLHNLPSSSKLELELELEWKFSGILGRKDLVCLYTFGILGKRYTIHRLGWNEMGLIEFCTALKWGY
jgi:hypothetical protein